MIQKKSGNIGQRQFGIARPSSSLHVGKLNLISKVLPPLRERSTKPPATFLLTMVTDISAWLRHPFTDTNESWSPSSTPENKQGVGSPGILLEGLRGMKSLLPSGKTTSIERSEVQARVNLLSSLTNVGIFPRGGSAKAAAVERQRSGAMYF